MFDKWENIRLSIEILKVHGVEDHVFNQIDIFNGICCFI